MLLLSSYIYFSLYGPCFLTVIECVHTNMELVNFLFDAQLLFFFLKANLHLICSLSKRISSCHITENDDKPSRNLFFFFLRQKLSVLYGISERHCCRTTLPKLGKKLHIDRCGIVYLSLSSPHAAFIYIYISLKSSK